MKKETTADHYTPEEAAKRRDEAIKKMLNTPPQPHKPIGKSKKNKKA